jgi:hypothetical protein
MSFINVLHKVNGSPSRKMLARPFLSGVCLVSLARQRVQIYLQKYSLLFKDWVAPSHADILKNPWFDMALMMRTPSYGDLPSDFVTWNKGCPS